MNESKSRIVHVDATLELKDYFHAFVDAAKTKLIIACLIVAFVIAAFTYFFIIIDEQKILWEVAKRSESIGIMILMVWYLPFVQSRRDAETHYPRLHPALKGRSKIISMRYVDFFI